MQFSVIRTYAASRFRDVGLVVVADADWKNYVNSVYGNVLMTLPYAPWNEQSTTLTFAPSTRSMALPTDAWRVTAVWDQTNQFPLVPLEGRMQVFNEYPQQTEIGMAMHYRVFDNLLEVYPLPQSSTIYVVEYFKMPADMAADADLPVFPEQYHDMLVAGAVAMAYRDDGNAQAASGYEAEYQSMLKALQLEMGQPRQDRFYEITDTLIY